LLAVGLFSASALAFTTGPAGAQTTGSTTTTAPAVTLPTPSTTAAPAPTTTKPPATTAPKPSTTATTRPKSAGVPPVPVGGPPTTAPPPGAKPAPPPDPTPILLKVDGDLAQLTAIADYKPAQALVAKAQDRVTQAGATLLSARQAMQAAHNTKGTAAAAKSVADNKLKQLAIAAYVGVGFTSPGLNEPAGGNGHQGAGTVSTPEGLTGIEALDAKEMLIIVGQKARQNDSDASHVLQQAAKAARTADDTYRKDQAAVAAAEAQLLSAQQTLKLVTTAAITPGAAAATPLPDLLTAVPTATTASGQPTTTSTTSTIPGAQTDAALTPVVNNGKPTSPAILSPPQLNADQLTAWWATLNAKPNITVPIDQLIKSYATWGAKLGVRYDVAFAQSIVETGYFSFPSFGQLTPKDNNFAGIGACDTCAHGWSFPTADTGVEAQLELLRQYATDAPLPTGVKNVIGATGVGGCCKTWTQSGLRALSTGSRS
jgi:hypothetical protein